MRIGLNNEQCYTLKFERGERFLETILAAAKKAKLKSGWFIGLGALEDPEIAYYDLGKKFYLRKKFRGLWEVTSLIGNVAVLKSKPIIHAHVTLTGKNFQAFGGHLVDGIIGGALEVNLWSASGLRRGFDQKTGLNLLESL